MGLEQGGRGIGWLVVHIVTLSRIGTELSSPQGWDHIRTPNLTTN